MWSSSVYMHGFYMHRLMQEYVCIDVCRCIVLCLFVYGLCIVYMYSIRVRVCVCVYVFL